MDSQIYVKKPSWLRSKFKDIPFIITVVGIALLASLAIFGIAYGVIYSTEPGLDSICIDDGTVSYTDQNCEKEPIIWPKEQIPLGVKVYYDFGQGVYKGLYTPLVAKTVASINDDVGFTLLEVVDVEPHILVLVDGDNALDTGGYSHTAYGGKLAASVQLSNVSSQAVGYILLKQLLLHAIGLANDNYKSSIMYTPLVIKHNAITGLRLTDKDRNLLRKLYANP
jgi:hypothetical protein